jgi:hypothetical protein
MSQKESSIIKIKDTLGDEPYQFHSSKGDFDKANLLPASMKPQEVEVQLVSLGQVEDGWDGGPCYVWTLKVHLEKPIAISRKESENFNKEKVEEILHGRVRQGSKSFGRELRVIARALAHGDIENIEAKVALDFEAWKGGGLE